MESEDEMKHLKSEVRALEKKMDRILSYLEDDGPTAKLGLVHTVTAMKENQDKFYLKYRVNMAVSRTERAALVTVGTVLAFILEWLFKIFFK